MLTFITYHCCSLQSDLHQDLCDYWKILFELYTRQIATVPEFWGHSDNKALRLAISFLETRRNHKGPNQVSGGQQPFCQLPEIAAVNQQSWFHHHSRHFWQTCSLRHCKMALHWSSYIFFANFLHIFICVTWGGMTSCSHPSRDVSARMNQEKPLKSPCSLHENDTESCLGHFMCSWCTFPKYEANLNTNALFIQISHYKIIFIWITPLCLQQTKNAGSLVKTQLYCLTISYIFQPLFHSHHQADANSIKVRNQYRCSTGQRSQNCTPTNIATVLFPSFYTFGISLILATNWFLNSNVNTCSEAMQRDVATKLIAMTQTKVILWHLMMESCTMYLLFSVNVLTVGIFRHAFKHWSMDQNFSR